jgi:hypothetical protein
MLSEAFNVPPLDFVDGEVFFQIAIQIVVTLLVDTDCGRGVV